MTIYHYHKGDCNLEKVTRCLEKLTKEFKIGKQRWKISWMDEFKYEIVFEIKNLEQIEKHLKH